MPPKAEKKPAEKSTAIAGKAPAKAAKGVKKVGGGRKKARKQTYSTYIYKGKEMYQFMIGSLHSSSCQPMDTNQRPSLLSLETSSP